MRTRYKMFTLTIVVLAALVASCTVSATPPAGEAEVVDEGAAAAEEPVFVESGTKQLVTSDGEIIESSVEAQYFGVELPSAQLRDVSVAVLEESADRLNVALQYWSIVRPETSAGNQLAINYTHNVLINGQEGRATAEGFIDLDSGIVVVEGAIDDYIEGYQFWPVSWITFVSR